jgi:isochorismate pyruvate lyase
MTALKEIQMEFKRTFSGSPWEPKIGYCRALRAGQHIYVTGTAPVAEGGGVFAPNDPYRQTQRCFEIIGKALKNLGADLKDVVRTRMYVTDISKWQDIGRAHGEVFSAHPPATTIVEVKSLIDAGMMVEIEADAVVAG